MSDSANRRVQAIGNHLAGGSIPAISKVAPSGPRVGGKVVIITGTLIHLLEHRLHYCKVYSPSPQAQTQS